MNKANLFLHYAATHPGTVLTYHRSDMVLAIHLDTSYLTEPQARIRSGGYHYLSSGKKQPPNNDTVLNVAQITKAAMSLETEAEIGALYINS